MSHHSRQGEVGKQFSCGRIWVLVKCEDVLSSCIDGRHLINWQLLLKLGCYWLPFSYLLETYTWSSCALSLYTEFITVCCVGVHSAEGGFGSYLTHCIKDNYTVDSNVKSSITGQGVTYVSAQQPNWPSYRYVRGNREQQRRNMHPVYNVIWLKKLNSVARIASWSDLFSDSDAIYLKDWMLNTFKRLSPYDKINCLAGVIMWPSMQLLF